ncbi:hypothetical protein ECFDA505_0932 [Escherichia coli FDA505]|nr:hypothetical protein ECFDA505_0932 [Escherichia coli FDA505]EKH41237.1 hypothetical protein ECFRIK1999_1170 [Escherichia coli FRIK1999]
MKIRRHSERQSSGQKTASDTAFRGYNCRRHRFAGTGIADPGLSQGHQCHYSAAIFTAMRLASTRIKL